MDLVADSGADVEGDAVSVGELEGVGLVAPLKADMGGGAISVGEWEGEDLGGTGVVLVGEWEGVDLVDVDGDGIWAGGRESYFLFLHSFPLWQKLLQSIAFFLHGHLLVSHTPEQLHLFPVNTFHGEDNLAASRKVIL